MSEVTAVPLRPIAKGSLTKLWAGIAIAAVVAIGLAWKATEAQVLAGKPPAEFMAANARKSGVKATQSGLQYEVLKEGSGAKATPEDMALVKYDGRFVDGKSFDTADQPVPLPVGRMIPGFSEGLQLMSRGARYRLWIPPQLGYGEQPVPDPRTGEIKIPGNSILVFDVEIVELAPASALGMGGMGGMR